jgi:hypothetical protein
MKTHHLFFLSLFVITACQKPKENTSQLQFTIDAFDVAQDQMEVTFEVTNPSEDVWQGGQWTLHWNQFSGVLQQESLPEGIHIVPTKNSQYWQLHFGSSYSLNPGETLKFSALQTGIMPRLVMGPIGFFVHNASQDKLYDLESQIHWEKAPGVSDLNLPTAADRYATYEGITPLPKEDLHWVLPTPQKIELQNDYRPFPTTLSIDFGAFQEQAAFLSERMQQGLDFSLTTNSGKSSNSNSKRQHLGRRGLSVGHRSGKHHDCSFRLQWLVLWYGVPPPDFNSCSKGRRWHSLVTDRRCSSFWTSRFYVGFVSELRSQRKNSGNPGLYGVLQTQPF